MRKTSSTPKVSCENINVPKWFPRSISISNHQNNAAAEAPVVVELSIEQAEKLRGQLANCFDIGARTRGGQSPLLASVTNAVRGAIEQWQKSHKE